MRGSFLFVFSLLLLPTVGRPETACLTTLPPVPPFTPPAPYESLDTPDGAFWYGTDALWTQLATEGVWHTTNNVDKSGGYVTKLVFWAKGFDWHKEFDPKLIITARRTDGDAPSVAEAGASAVFVGAKAAIMTGIRIPRAGCWEVSAYYGGHVLTLVVLVHR
jgi:hypothetical protein